MPEITIEGSRITPSVVLAPGERRTVTVTPRVRELLRRGYVVKVEAAAPPAQPEPEVVVAPVASTDEDEDEAEAEQPAAEHPPYNADRATWASFLDGLQPPIPYTADDKRDVLINRWQQSVGGG